MTIIDKIDYIHQYDEIVATELTRLYNGLIDKINAECQTDVIQTINVYEQRYDTYLDSYVSYINRIKNNTDIASLVEEGITSNYNLLCLTGSIININFDNIVTFVGLKAELSHRPDDYFFSNCITTLNTDIDETLFESDEQNLQEISDVVSAISNWGSSAKQSIKSKIMQALFETLTPFTYRKEEIADIIYCSTNLAKFLHKYDIPAYIPSYLDCPR